MFELPASYDVVVIGSGHAGIEAALAAARLGCRTVMITQNLDTIGQMSCNPAIGGLAKGHIVREVDALGGAMGANADATGIQFRMLNRKKGPSVRGPRAQCDKKAYQFRLKAVLERTPLLDVKQATVTEVLTDGAGVCGVVTDLGMKIKARTAVITSGTFLRGLLHVGETQRPGGRMADSSSGLSGNLQRLGLQIGRFKTGTPCRLNGRSIDFSQCEIQEGDEPPPRFTFFPEESGEDDIFTLNPTPGGKFHVEQIPCWITHTTTRTHDIIRANLHRSPLYAGRIEGTGPRYCPSIEDKVVKFAEKPAHQLFLEPEGRHTEEYYVNGISTSLPYDVQLAFIRSIPSLANAEMMRPGYAVEYDYFPPTQLLHTLESKIVSRLFFAGQVNGTSGYEEAAAQGLIAGANAACRALQRSPFILGRESSYIGVLIDDLVTKGTEEPYRMFTSRAENRLHLRQDNADQRLTGLGHDAGLVGQARWNHYQEKRELLDRITRMATETKLAGTPLVQLLKRSDFSKEQLPSEILALAPLEIWELLETDLKYAGYAIRQSEQNERLLQRRHQAIPDGFDFSRVPGLRSESRQKLCALRPTSIEQAARISGMTPADLSILSIWLIKNNLHSEKTAASV